MASSSNVVKFNRYGRTNYCSNGTSAFYRCTTCGCLAQKGSHACKMSSSLNHLNGLPLRLEGNLSSTSFCSAPSTTSISKSDSSSATEGGQTPRRVSIKNAAVVSASSLGNNKTYFESPTLIEDRDQKTFT